MPNPDVGGREKILRVHMRNVPLASDVDVRVIARGTPGFSGADLANLVNEAALMAARRNRRMVMQRDFEDAKDKVMMGAERKSMVMDRGGEAPHPPITRAVTPWSRCRCPRRRSRAQGDDHPARPGAGDGHCNCPRATATR